VERDDVHELRAAYALDALDERDAAAFEEHLSRCADCRRDLAALQDAAAALAHGADATEEPPELRDRILARARAERPNVRPLPRPWAFRAAVAVAAVAAGVAVVFGVWAASLSADLDREREARVARERAIAVVADPGARSFPVEGGSGVLVVSPAGEAVLVASMNRAPGEATYKLWIVRDKRPLPDSAFDGAGASDVVRLDGRLRRGDVVAVTVETDPDVEAPTTTPFATAQT
jgi:anti-sigma factor RsiW